MTPTPAPYGSWPTPITADLVVTAAVRLGELAVDGGDLVWAEGRPAEDGRTQLVRRVADGTTTDLLPEGMSARTAVHEYGGAGWWVRDGVVWFTEWSDQRLYRLAPGCAPQPLTAEPERPRGDRYADGDVAPDGATLVCVRERHAGPAATDVRNEIVRLATDTPSAPEVLVTGPDFVAAPRLAPDGRTLAWVQWDHPSMPWDSTELVVRDLSTGEDTVVAGGRGESVSEPRWHPDGSLWFLSDRTQWWSLYRWVAGADIEPVVVGRGEIGVPNWALGSARYAFLADGSVAFARRSAGYDTLSVRGADGTVTDLDLGFSAVEAVRALPGGALAVVAGSATAEDGVHRIDLPVQLGAADAPAPRVTTLRPPRELGIDPAYLSVPEPITFGSVDADGASRNAHGLYYPPANPQRTGAEGELPPLLVMIHGGPTASARPVLSLGVQFWTSRGFAVVDVDYGGSTGYGRDYRDQLLGQWGVIDVADCLAAAAWLAKQGRADPDRLCIRGGSAGGYTTLAALAREDTPFAAGASHYGVADLEALAADTHKFESRYLDRLVGPYPEARDVYVERSPIHHVDRLRRPLLVLQGSEDEIVPPAQSEVIVAALRERGIPVGYLLFEGEQHGFRRAENIRRALEAELSFYGRVLGFELPAEEGIEPVELENA
ncbi:S9 family peptidase [Pseudonocardia humida]|uniref:S9 family peptidase n=1 Tax=Pseudonocardia humida TaxID=2800819 RepID=A0ABT1ACQ9_9PSEU|nr:S9 family peptidase [Pseudonocardia humida]MCO1660850.1 S9 family peptidase [Pseudonocardia humida]